MVNRLSDEEPSMFLAWLDSEIVLQNGSVKLRVLRDGSLFLLSPERGEWMNRLLPFNVTTRGSRTVIASRFSSEKAV